MSEKREVPPKNILERIAKKNGIAVVVVDETGKQSPAVNNNSICAVLNPDGVLVGRCARDCGRALERSREENATISYTCHAGLLCPCGEIRVRRQTCGGDRRGVRSRTRRIIAVPRTAR
ncbi:MAG: hypothetical protein UZ17_ACD001001023 [Acidobacteria bacterium OLB17]|nr:MAG: hypothetical protein UZ17_ACD001001023 [Acidobacteria bacterium OLB17]